MQINLITVGKLKNKELETLCHSYEKRMKAPSLKTIELKAYSETPNKEAQEVIKKLQELSKSNSSQFHILMTEWGAHFESPDFSKWLQEKIEAHSQVNFIIAGAQGPHEELKNFCHCELSLSKLTFPHKLARLILTEQLYRAQTIRTKHPYHN